MEYNHTYMPDQSTSLISSAGLT